jgi:hypothetical protein
LSDSLSFKVIVVAVSAPRILEISESPAGQIKLVWEAVAGKNYRVNWVQPTPIDLSGQTARLEPCAAPQKRAVMVLGCKVELQPCFAGQLHFCPEQHIARRVGTFDPPEVDDIAGFKSRLRP